MIIDFNEVFSGKNLSLKTTIYDAQNLVVAQQQTPVSYDQQFDQNLKVVKPSLWSPENPYLYKAVTQLYSGDELKDEVATKFGIRSINYSAENGFQLNGETRKFKGVCLHHDLGPLGTAVNKAALRRQMQILKDLHKDDKMKLQQEMMALYKREKVNPISGCLPVLIQIPFFFAIYKMLFVTIEMRQQPFFGWIQDLSARDPTSIFNLFGLIPWDPPSFLLIGAWPILMGISMYIQQLLNPQMPDPVQRRIFQFFPLFLTIILAPFPSGLVIYWTVNNILQMGQQYLVMRKTQVKTK